MQSALARGLSNMDRRGVPNPQPRIQPPTYRSTFMTLFKVILDMGTISLYLLGLQIAIDFTLRLGFRTAVYCVQVHLRLGTAEFANMEWMSYIENVVSSCRQVATLVAMIITLLFIIWYLHLQFMDYLSTSEILALVVRSGPHVGGLLLVLLLAAIEYPWPWIGVGLCRAIYSVFPIGFAYAMTAEEMGTAETTIPRRMKEELDATNVSKMDSAQNIMARWCDFLKQEITFASDSWQEIEDTIGRNIATCSKRFPVGDFWDSTFHHLMCTINGVLFSPNDISPHPVEIKQVRRHHVEQPRIHASITAADEYQQSASDYWVYITYGGIMAAIVVLVAFCLRRRRSKQTRGDRSDISGNDTELRSDGPNELATESTQNDGTGGLSFGIFARFIAASVSDSCKCFSKGTDSNEVCQKWQGSMRGFMDLISHRDDKCYDETIKEFAKDIVDEVIIRACDTLIGVKEIDYEPTESDVFDGVRLKASVSSKAHVAEGPGIFKDGGETRVMDGAPCDHVDRIIIPADVHNVLNNEMSPSREGQSVRRLSHDLVQNVVNAAILALSECEDLLGEELIDTAFSADASVRRISHDLVQNVVHAAITTLNKCGDHLTEEFVEKTFSADESVRRFSHDFVQNVVGAAIANLCKCEDLLVEPDDDVPKSYSVHKPTTSHSEKVPFEVEFTQSVRRISRDIVQHVVNEAMTSLGERDNVLSDKDGATSTGELHKPVSSNSGEGPYEVEYSRSVRRISQDIVKHVVNAAITAIGECKELLSEVGAAASNAPASMQARTGLMESDREPASVVHCDSVRRASRGLVQTDSGFSDDLVEKISQDLIRHDSVRRISRDLVQNVVNAAVTTVCEIGGSTTPHNSFCTTNQASNSHSRELTFDEKIKMVSRVLERDTSKETVGLAYKTPDSIAKNNDEVDELVSGDIKQEPPFPLSTSTVSKIVSEERTNVAQLSDNTSVTVDMSILSEQTDDPSLPAPSSSTRAIINGHSATSRGNTTMYPENSSAFVSETCERDDGTRDIDDVTSSARRKQMSSIDTVSAKSETSQSSRDMKEAVHSAPTVDHSVKEHRQLTKESFCSSTSEPSVNCELTTGKEHQSEDNQHRHMPSKENPDPSMESAFAEWTSNDQHRHMPSKESQDPSIESTFAEWTSNGKEAQNNNNAASKIRIEDPEGDVGPEEFRISKDTPVIKQVTTRSRTLSDMTANKNENAFPLQPKHDVFDTESENSINLYGNSDSSSCGSISLSTGNSSKEWIGIYKRLLQEKRKSSSTTSCDRKA